MVEVELIGLRVEMPTNTPVVLLKEKDEPGRVLPIFIGGPEATAIAFALERVETARPMTHDLFVDALKVLGAQLTRVEITEVVDRVFYAELVLVSLGGETRVSSRPSDAIALALRVGAALFAAEAVMAQAGQQPMADETQGDPEELVEEFRQFLSDINPEDFSS